MNCPARVTKVKSRTPKHPARLRHEISRVYLKRLAKGMLIAIAVLLASATVLAVSGCATGHVREVCGTLPDGSEFCTLIKEHGHA